MAIEAPPLEAEIRRLISIAGPMPIAQYMATCLCHPIHGYYMTRDPFGASGDFVTAPEISQMFGELLGLWTASVWKAIGSPPTLRLVELGPGRGTMMADALRAIRVLPPLYQAIKQEDGWHERVVMVDKSGNFTLGALLSPLTHLEKLLPPRVRDAPAGSIFEWRTDSVALEIGRRVTRSGGAALVIDYGHLQSEIGDTVQAVGEHAYANPLVAPGLVDLTAHVDFQSIAEAAESIGARIHGPLHQGDFLRRLGIATRAATLKASAPPGKVNEIDGQVQRLTGTGARRMGMLFKVLGIGDPKLGVLPGFESK